MSHPDSDFTHPLCAQCWDATHPDRRPFTVVEDETDLCCMCGGATRAGIYVRATPSTLGHCPARINRETLHGPG